MASNRDVRATVGFTVDTASVAKAAASYATVADAARTFSTEVLRLNPQLQATLAQEQAAAAGTQRLADTQLLAADASRQNASALASQRAPVQSLTDLYAGLEAQEKAAAAAAETVNVKSAGGVSAGQAAGRIAGIGSIVGSAGGGEGLRDISQIVNLGATFGIAGAAAGVAAVFIKQATDAETKRAEAAKATADELNKLAGSAAAGATTASIKAQIVQEEAHRRVLQETQSTLQEQSNKLAILKEQYAEGTIGVEEYQTVMGMLGKNVDELTGGAVTAAGGVLDLGKLLTDNQASIDASTHATALYNVELGTSAVAQNDVAAAAAKLRDAQVDAAQKTLEIDKLTTEQRAEQIAEDKRNIDILNDLIQNTDLSTDAAELLSVQVGELEVGVRKLEGVSITYADVLEREKAVKDALVDSSNGITDSLQDLAAAEKDVRDASEKSAEAQGKLGDALTEHRDKQQQVILDQYAKQGAAEAQQLMDEGKARAKAAEDGERQEHTHQLRLLAIQAQFAYDAQTAIYRRSADQHFLAERARDKANREENAANKERTDAITVALDEQLKVAKARYDEQVKAAKEAAVKAIAAEQDRYDKQYRNLQDSLNKAVSAERTANAALEVQRRVNASSIQYWNAVVANSYTALGNASAMLANKVTQAATQILNGASGNALVGGGSSNGYSAVADQVARDRQAAIAAAYQDYYRRQGMPVQGYARGIAHVPFDQLAYLHRGERVLTAQQNRMLTPNGSAGGITVNVPVTGTQLRRRDIVRIVDQQVDSTLSAAGYE